MRLKTFNAPSMAEAMNLVKTHLGPDAIIVSTQKGDGGLGVRITAAIEAVEDEDHYDQYVEDADPLDEIADALAHHNVPGELADKLTRAAGSLDADDPLLALAGALDQHFKFQPVPMSGRRPVLLMGMPGAGKTVTTAKLATRAVMNRRPVSVITTDTQRAGGYEQLHAFTRLLEVDLQQADTPAALQDAVSAARPDSLILVDCAGGNPFEAEDAERQRRLIEAIEAEAVLVMAAGGDPLEAADQAHAYAAIGARRLLATRLDIARRLGGLLSAASAGRLAFTEVGIGANVADGLAPLNPVSLARLLLPKYAATRDQAAE
jgi:flagellar biosynthesis protein FlhF